MIFRVMAKQKPSALIAMAFVQFIQNLVYAV
jgi:hypothetical protein